MDFGAPTVGQVRATLGCNPLGGRWLVRDRPLRLATLPMNAAKPALVSGILAVGAATPGAVLSHPGEVGPTLALGDMRTGRGCAATAR